MQRTINTSNRRAILRAYFEGMSLVDINRLFKVGFHNVINIVHEYLILSAKQNKQERQCH